MRTNIELYRDRLWGTWLHWCDTSRRDEALALVGALTLILLAMLLCWGVFCALTQAQVVGVVLLPVAMLAKHGKEKK